MSQIFNIIRFAGFVGLSMISLSAANANEYAEGQVWEYQTRPTESDSLLRIQSIETNGHSGHESVIFHISIVGLALADGQVLDILPHIPVSAGSLDQSVTRLSESGVSFPDASDGIQVWREANGGVYTISIAEIVDIADRIVTEAVHAQQLE